MFALVLVTKLLRTVKVLVTVSIENKKFQERKKKQEVSGKEKESHGLRLCLCGYDLWKEQRYDYHQWKIPIEAQ